MNRIIHQINVVFNDFTDFIIFVQSFIEDFTYWRIYKFKFFIYSSPVKYSYLSNFLDDNTEILTASLSKSY